MNVSEKKVINYRSYKNLDEVKLKNDLESIPFDVINVFDQTDDVFWAYEKLVNNVLDEHIPVKQKVLKNTRAPSMNGPLRRAINVKRGLFRKYRRCNSEINWQNFRRQRNYVTKLKRQSIRHYFAERCGGGTKSKYFWPTIKPFLTNKGSSGESCIQLYEDRKLITCSNEVSEVFNDFFVNVANNIGNDATCDIDQEHPSVQAIKAKMLVDGESFAFQNINATKYK